MSTITKIEHWADTHRQSWLVVFRVTLGVFLTYRGFYFLYNIDQLQEMTLNVALMSTGVAHYVVFAHILGGMLLAVGLFTRWASLVQIPILIGAVIFVNYPSGFLSVGNHFELEISILVLVFLVIFSVMGAGRYSLDEKRRNEES